jgi:hypothetical protein
MEYALAPGRIRSGFDCLPGVSANWTGRAPPRRSPLSVACEARTGRGVCSWSRLKAPAAAVGVNGPSGFSASDRVLSRSSPRWCLLPQTGFNAHLLSPRSGRLVPVTRSRQL